MAALSAVRRRFPAFRVFDSLDFASTLLLNIGNIAVNSAATPDDGINLPGANS